MLSTDAVGNLCEEYPPRTIVVPDGTVDRTTQRARTFFGGEAGKGIIVHIGFADPYCPHLADHLVDAAVRATDDGAIEGGTYLCIEGPQFPTRAESEYYRTLGFDLVGMTAIPEAKLAREAELCYATLAEVTDDGRRSREGTPVELCEIAAANRGSITATVREAIETLPAERDCECANALEGAITTDLDTIPETTRDRLSLLVNEYR